MQKAYIYQHNKVIAKFDHPKVVIGKDLRKYAEKCVVVAIAQGRAAKGYFRLEIVDNSSLIITDSEDLIV